MSETCQIQTGKSTYFCKYASGDGATETATGVEALVQSTLSPTFDWDAAKLAMRDSWSAKLSFTCVQRPTVRVCHPDTEERPTYAEYPTERAKNVPKNPTAEITAFLNALRSGAFISEIG